MLLGKKFLLKAGKKLLVFSFNHRKELHKVASSRILTWAFKLMAFNFGIMFSKGNAIPHVNALSRLNLIPKMLKWRTVVRTKFCTV